MLQSVDGVEVYVVEFDEMPELPIEWGNEEERPYAMALAHAIESDVIKGSGKYAIHIEESDDEISYRIYQVMEDEEKP